MGAAVVAPRPREEDEEEEEAPRTERERPRYLVQLLWKGEKKIVSGGKGGARRLKHTTQHAQHNTHRWHVNKKSQKSSMSLLPRWYMDEYSRPSPDRYAWSRRV